MNDLRIEPMARALERARHPEWTDEQFEIWWNHDPVFVERVTCWSHFGPGTRKEHVLWEAEQCLKAMPGYAPPDPTHIIRIYPIGCRGETLYEEPFVGTDLQAERRLSEVWNDQTPPDGSRFRAVLRRTGERRTYMRIG